MSAKMRMPSTITTLVCAGQTEEKQADLSAFAKGLTEQYEFAGYLTEMTPEYPYYEEDMNRSQSSPVTIMT